LATRILVVDDSPTIRKVVTSLLERHGYEAVAAADGTIALELLTESTFDLVLVDFVMPRMNGFQFCRALRSKESLSDLPVVLMSAKSDKIREQFVQQTGAIDAITKPFDAQALVAVIENAIRRSETWKARGAALAAGIPEEFEPDARPSSGGLEVRRARVIHEMVKRLSATLAPILSRAPAHTPEAINQTIRENLLPDTLRAIVEAIGTIDFGFGGRLALSGDLSIIPIGAVLQLLQIENQTGVLTVTNGSTEVTLAMRMGLIDMVTARGAGQEFRLGRYFVEEGLVTPGEIDRLLREHGISVKSGENGTMRSIPPPAFGSREESTVTRATRLLGDVLVDAGKVSPDQLKDALARQSSELTYETLRWSEGRFEFRREAPPPLAESAKLSLPVASVVMEGFRRVDEWRLIENGLGSFDSVLTTDPLAVEALGTPDPLSKQERIVLEAVNGERTVREIIEMVHMSSFDACKILYGMLEARLVRRKVL
jgi:DNA-binding response OmpR family regulator